MANLTAITVKHWGRLAVRSVVLGIAFFGADLLIALVQGQAFPFHFVGGMLGLPLTFLICPVGTIICLAGLARAYYISKRPSIHPLSGVPVISVPGGPGVRSGSGEVGVSVCGLGAC